MYFYHLPFSEVRKLTPFQVFSMLEWLQQYFEKAGRRRGKII
jgi:hypothetical protein